jgi:hypothetical protein
MLRLLPRTFNALADKQEVKLETIKRSELLHFSKVASRDDVVELDDVRRAELVENAISVLYRVEAKAERDELLSLVQTIMMQSDNDVSQKFSETGYVRCNQHLVITFANNLWLKRSGVEWHEIVGKSLYFEKDYENTPVEQLYSMVMETRLIGDSLVRYSYRTVGGKIFDGWFVLIVIPMDDGGIGVISKFSRNRKDFMGDIDESDPQAPKYIRMGM